MSSKIRFRSLVGIALAVGLLWSLACGGAEEATPTPTATTAPAAQPTNRGSRAGGNGYAHAQRHQHGSQNTVESSS